MAERWGHYFVVREDDGRVVGVAGLEVHGDDGLLRSVAVDPDYRGQGLAASLVEAALERARSGCSCARSTCSRPRRATTSRGAASPTARARRRPRAIRESWEFRIGCPSTAAFMKRPVA